jgi:hypothetical protein
MVRVKGDDGEWVELPGDDGFIDDSHILEEDRPDGDVEVGPALAPPD